MPESWDSFGLVALDVCWGLFCLVWLAGVVHNVRHAPPVARCGGARGSFVIWVAAVLLLFALRRLVPVHNWDAVSYRAPWLGALGVVALVAGTVFTIWARWRLGVMWTSDAVVKVGHELRTDGPYRITRHPIYTGLLGMLIGTVLISGLGLWVLVLVFGVLFLEIKLRAEERLLSSAFPEQYAEFRRRVPQLVPLARLPRS